MEERTRTAPTGGGIGIAAAVLCMLACVPAWVAHQAVATIADDEEGAGGHVAYAVIGVAFAALFVGYAVGVWGSRGAWRLGAAVLLPLAWLPSALDVAFVVQLIVTVALAVAGIAALVASLETHDHPAGILKG